MLLNLSNAQCWSNYQPVVFTFTCIRPSFHQNLCAVYSSRYYSYSSSATGLVQLSYSSFSEDRFIIVTAMLPLWVFSLLAKAEQSKDQENGLVHLKLSSMWTIIYYLA